MTTLAPFIDAEKAVVLTLENLVASGSIDTETPKNLVALVPFIRVSRFGGQSTRWEDNPRIDVDVFCTRDLRTQGLALALACQARLLSFPHVTSVGVIDEVDTDISPNETPWQNTALRHITSSYKVTVRR